MEAYDDEFYANEKAYWLAFANNIATLRNNLFDQESIDAFTNAFNDVFG